MLVGWILFMIVMACLWQPRIASAADESSLVLKIIKFSAGAISAYGLHESGHALAAKLTNTDLDWGVGTYNQPLGFTENSSSDFDGALVHSAGLITQVVCSEIILQDDSIDKNDTFVRGMMFWNIFNPLIYVLDYWLIGATNKVDQDCYQGDIGGVEHYAGPAAANIFSACVAGLALYQGYRFLSQQDWAPAWAGKGQFTSFGLLPAEGGGLILRLSIDF